MKLSIIVPCYNEEKGLPNLFRQLEDALPELKKSYEIELIFIDDGSKHNTYRILKERYAGSDNVKIIKHKKNMNLGAAVRTGFANATGDVIATMDSDCTYPPTKIIDLLKLLDEDTDIVTGSPYHPKGHVKDVPPYRLFLSKATSKIYSMILHYDIHTYTALFRVYKRKVVKDVKFYSNDFLCCAEFLIYALLKKYKVKEYPTTLYSRKYGRSNIRLLKVISSHIRFMIKLLWIKLTKRKI